MKGMATKRISIPNKEISTNNKEDLMRDRDNIHKKETKGKSFTISLNGGIRLINSRKEEGILRSLKENLGIEMNQGSFSQ